MKQVSIFSIVSPIERDVFGRGDLPLGAAQDVCDAHQVVIHHVGQVVGGEAVRLQQHRVPLLGSHVEQDVTVHQVRERRVGALQLGGRGQVTGVTHLTVDWVVQSSQSTLNTQLLPRLVTHTCELGCTRSPPPTIQWSALQCTSAQSWHWDHSRYSEWTSQQLAVEDAEAVQIIDGEKSTRNIWHSGIHWSWCGLISARKISLTWWPTCRSRQPLFCYSRWTC